MKKINVAIIGVGSFTKALVEGVSFYIKNEDETRGLINPLVGDYKVSDINFVAAFDVDERKVGKKLHEAISQGANVTKDITSPVEFEAKVYRGPTADGVVEQMKGSFVKESSESSVDIAKVLKETGADVVLNLVPTGSDEATRMYAEAALDAGCSFINCIPTPLATIESWQKRFQDKGLVLLGDDTKSQLGATMLNRILLEALAMRGIQISKTEQDNIGGNADHFNLLYRKKSKEKTKSEALSSFIDCEEVKPKVTFQYTGKPSGSKRVELRIEGEMFGRTPIKISAVIEDEISINGAGTVVDAIRVAKLLVDRGMQKESEKVCAFLMKSPAKKMADKEAIESFRKIIEKK
ncbi:inositol-3-phosphate synthase [Candidatus Woesearchaeota archaeon]|nr:inositol-3-phosphate synthase [Candidatus Woesearchaeota archaeon]MBT3537472.1 inositol-3-phosphate synthase [Candidatus Woesearchaeota archaeon]MBT4697259.1 inositol-3-phosphate synthase [Candidatus Woesearchaeota archaeon]MBT4717347.1 inositol-3-phosphate synthase [Candidatus Woesearchaeota archaeon]MBT7106218.1 inositol-3-phosphate synthase [Candidatus Woesearchaeota archaeon]